MTWDEKDIHLLSRFRRNARESLTTASRKTGIPVSTIHDKLQRYSGSVIRRPTLLLNFTALGYSLKVVCVVRVERDDREALERFLNGHPRVNSLYKVSSGQDYIVEGIFKDLQEFSIFVDKVDTFRIIERREFYIIDDMKQEGFMSTEELLEMSS